MLSCIFCLVLKLSLNQAQCLEAGDFCKHKAKSRQKVELSSSQYEYQFKLLNVLIMLLQSSRILALGLVTKPKARILEVSNLCTLTFIIQNCLSALPGHFYYAVLNHKQVENKFPPLSPKVCFL